MNKITPGQRRAQRLKLRPQSRTNNIFNQGELGPARTEADRLNAERIAHITRLAHHNRWKRR